MSDFDKWFKKNFSDLHESICCGDLVAIKYKKAIKKAWDFQQKKIDSLLDKVCGTHEDFLNESKN